jgi:hypothetical protein
MLKANCSQYARRAVQSSRGIREDGGRPRPRDRVPRGIFYDYH